MIILANIIKALTINVRKTLGVKANDRDIEEGFERPSFYIDVDEIEDTTLTDEFTYDTYQLSIYFFAEKREKGFKDVLQAREKLSQLLRNRLETEEGFGFTFDEIKHVINKADKSLITTFSIVAVQRIEDTSDTPMIEELEVRI